LFGLAAIIGGASLVVEATVALVRGATLRGVGIALIGGAIMSVVGYAYWKAPLLRGEESQ
jgi:hypothetical protein